MLEYFTYKKVKKHQAEKAERERLEQDKIDVAKAKQEAASSSSTAQPVKIITSPDGHLTNDKGQHLLVQPLLDQDDEKFLERLTSPESSATTPGAAAGDGDDLQSRPPLPPRPKTIDLAWESDASSVASVENGKGKGNDDKQTTTDAKGNRLSFITNIPRSISVRVRGTKDKNASTAAEAGKGPKANHLAVPSENEADREQAEVARVLDDLNLASSPDNKVFSLSKDSAEVVQRFTQVLKDLVNGVPTAYGDLVKLIEDRDKVINNNFEKLPNGLKKLVTQLPDQLTAKLAPEILAIAAEAQGLAASEAGGSLKGAAAQFANPKNLYDLVTKPGAVVGLLKGIVNALKARWPAFIGTNVLWSVAVFLLLSVLWYCYKRGREERLIKEAGANPIDGKDRIEELPDDPLLPSSQNSAAATLGRIGQEGAERSNTTETPAVTLSPPAAEQSTASAATTNARK